MLNEVAESVWVRQSAWVWSNATVVRGEGGLILVDPGIDGSGLGQLADDVDRLGLPVVVGFSTRAHWDHPLWHSRFGDTAHSESARTRRGGLGNEPQPHGAPHAREQRTVRSRLCPVDPSGQFA